MINNPYVFVIYGFDRLIKMHGFKTSYVGIWLLFFSGGFSAWAEPVATFSIVARDAETGALGVAVQSKFFAVGAVVPFAKAGVGAIATQAYANTTFGPKGLELLASGRSADEVLKLLIGADTGEARRQIGIVDAKGGAAAHTGKLNNSWAGHVVGTNFCVQGNILANESVVKEMAHIFNEGSGNFPERLVASLKAGQAAGGDVRGRQSAALLVVKPNGGYAGLNDRWIDIRVDDHDRPIEELARLLRIHREFYRR